MKPVIPQVTSDTWRTLYAAANAFRKLEPWNHLFDGPLFGVREPKTGQIFYCCILGAMGEVFALCAYRGGEGYEAWEGMHYGAPAPEDDDFDDIVARQNALIVQFVNKTELQPQDAKILKQLGITYKGRKVYPCFRSIVPGCPPWHITEDEALAMVAVLHCACLFATEHKRKPFPVGECVDKLLVYLPPADFATASSIPTCLEKPENPLHAPLSIAKVDRFRMNRLKAVKPSEDLIWEADSFINHGSDVLDKERPYWMRMIIVAAHKSGFILNMNLIPNDDDPYLAIADILMGAIEKHNQKPSELYVRDILALEVIRPLARDLNISVSVKERLSAMREVREALKEGFPRH